MALDEGTLAQARESRDRLLELRHQSERAQADFHHAIRLLHAGGGSLREIAEALGVSHQRVHQIVDGGAAGTRPLIPFRRRQPRPAARPYERFSTEARAAMTRAQVEAKQLGHDYVGTEHVLLALLGMGVAVEGLTPDAVRLAIIQRIGKEEPASAPGGPMRLTPRTKRALEHAFTQALRDEADIDPRHLLRGIAADPESVGAQILDELGVSPESL